MRISLLILLMHFISGACLNASAQGGEELIDIDRDGAADTLRMDTERGVIVCILSSHDFKPVESLPIDYLEWSWLYTENGDVHLVRNFNRYTEYFTFGYDPNEKRLMLTEFSMEQLGNVIGDGYVALCHSLDNGEVTKSTVDYIGSCDVDEFDPANFVSRDWEKGIDPIFIYFDEFSPDVYYDRAEKIWDNDYKEIVKEEKEASTFTERAKVQAGVFSSIFAGR